MQNVSLYNNMTNESIWYDSANNFGFIWNGNSYAVTSVYVEYDYDTCVGGLVN
jgi:hypothetical protein